MLGKEFQSALSLLQQNPTAAITAAMTTLRAEMPASVSDALKTATTNANTQIERLRTELTRTTDSPSVQLVDYNTRLLRLEGLVTGRPAIAGPGHLDASDPVVVRRYAELSRK